MNDAPEDQGGMNMDPAAPTDAAPVVDEDKEKEEEV